MHGDRGNEDVGRRRHVINNMGSMKMSMVIERIKIYWNNGRPCTQWATCIPEENHVGTTMHTVA